jgi:hypothetical protein
VLLIPLAGPPSGAFTAFSGAGGRPIFPLPPVALRRPQEHNAADTLRIARGRPGVTSLLFSPSLRCTAVYLIYPNALPPFS